ncbi:hypothetical protein B0J17DRAFT_671721 [Rhizoctonia solani]|nr:hypothetical protein B0J17DRAFT_671721 [Rhizoctonia solani]
MSQLRQPLGRSRLTSSHRNARKRRTYPKDKYEAAEAAVDAFKQAHTDYCIFGSLAFKLLGVACKPNDADIIVLDTTKSLEDLKEYLVGACNRFYLMPSRNRKAEYRVLWYATRKGARRVKVDILQPGEMSIPEFRANIISYETPPGKSGRAFSIPVAPLELVLLLKLGGWLEHYTSGVPHRKAKEPEDVKQIRALLIKYKRQFDFDYLPGDFVDQAEENVREYTSIYPSSKGSWRRVGLYH